MQKDLLAEKPRIPPPARSHERAAKERQEYLQKRELIEGRSVLRGLIILTLTILIISMFRADSGRVFLAGWWRP